MFSFVSIGDESTCAVSNVVILHYSWLFYAILMSAYFSSRNLPYWGFLGLIIIRDKFDAHVLTQEY